MLLRMVRRAHDDDLFRVQFSPAKSSTVASTGMITAGGLNVWHVKGGEVLMASRVLRCAVLSPDGRSIATASKFGGVELMDPNSGALLRTFALASYRMPVPRSIRPPWGQCVSLISSSPYRGVVPRLRERY